MTDEQKLLEAIPARHSVRKYIDKPIAEDALAVLQQRVDELNEKGNLHIQLITGEPKAFSGKMGYGTFSGISSYFVMAGPKEKDLDERIGYYGEELVLLAQSLGLNTCWAGVSYTKIPGTYKLAENEKIACYISLGYGLTQGKNRRSKSVSDVSNAGDDTPDWFKAGVEAALLAPTAVNQQKFYIEYLGAAEGSDKPKVSIKRGFSMIGYTQMDMGIAKLHFEIRSGRNNFEWA